MADVPFFVCVIFILLVIHITIGLFFCFQSIKIPNEQYLKLAYFFSLLHLILVIFSLRVYSCTIKYAHSSITQFGCLN